MSRSIAARGALGGAAAEMGSHYRARVGALVATAVLRQSPLSDLGFPEPGALARSLVAESDDPVDDLVVRLEDGSRVFVQAKRTAALASRADSPLGSALQQFWEAWQGGLEDGDLLVLATAEPSGPLRAVARGLDRDRLFAPGAPTSEEGRARAKLGDLAAACGIDTESLDAMCRHLVIWCTDPTTSDGEGLLIARLDGHVVQAGNGASAARVLTDEVRRLARMRAGADAEQLIDVLADRGLLISTSIAVGRRADEARALDAYRARMIHEGRTLELFGAPAELAHFPLSEADADVEVDVPGEDRDLGRRLEQAQRRRGRVVLVGAPGGGKSTALRALGAFAAERADWPVPIRVHLQQLAPAESAPTDALLDAAVSYVAPSPERDALRAALARELADGNCLLLLDGLDEVRRGRAALVHDLRRMLRDLPDSVEVVLASRPSAAEEARPLGLPALTLRPPDHPLTTVRAIVGAATPEDADEAWAEARCDWVGRAIDRDPALGRVPLTVVALALAAARSNDESELPASRAAILSRTLTDVLDGWEIAARLRGSATIGPLEGSLARRALLSAMSTLSALALGADPPSATGVAPAVRAALQRGFRLAPDEAAVAAEDAIAFWLDIGLFAYDDSRLVAAIRQLAELGQAWEPVHDHEPPAAEWVSAMRADEQWPSLALAAGLSPEIAGAWARDAGAGGGDQELAAIVAAIGDGAVLSATSLDGLVTGYADRLLSRSEWSEQTAAAFLRLDLPENLRRRLRPLLSASVPQPRRATVEALVICRWDERGPAQDALLRKFLSDEHPPRPDYLAVPEGDDAMSWFLAPSDDVFDDAHALAMTRLAAGSRDDAELIIDLFHDGSMDFRSALQDAFREAGHDDFAERVNADLEKHRAEQLNYWNRMDFEAIDRELFTVVADLAPAADLDRRQYRRLDDLADLVETASFNWMHTGWEGKRAEARSSWIRSVVDLGGFDPSIVAAQARIVLSAPSEDDLRRLPYDGGQDRDLRDWSHVTDPEARLRELVGAIRGIPHDASHSYLIAVASSPLPDLAVELLEECLPRFRIWARIIIAKTLLIAESEIPDVGRRQADERATAWLDDDDPLIRRAAATWWPFRNLSGDDTARRALTRSLDDPDRGVVAEAVRQLRPENLTPDLESQLQALRAAPPRGWVCRWCGHANDGTNSACGECSTNGPELRKEIAEALGERERPRPKRRRRVKRSD